MINLRVVAVHAHPDDEAIWTGGLLAHLAAHGADVEVITCTLGEQGEVIGSRYQNLVAADQLGGFRISELSESLTHLGIRGEFLRAPGYWRDSGMVGDAANEHPRAFIHSADKAVKQLIEQLRDHPPQLLISYGPDGGYGHPDHIRAHEITEAAARYLDIPVLWCVTHQELLADGLKVISAPAGWRMPKAGELACVDYSDFALRLSDDVLARKVGAMKAHATQIWVADGSSCATRPVAAYAPQSDPERAPFTFCLSNMIAQPLSRYEHYQFSEFSDPRRLREIVSLIEGIER
ncbi:N-acetyl-1-D-myo-inositol-2-amino-2-deoxy-alpha-D-glucopyranoside deacetylase [Corynebacterium sp. ES2794-CONJ1]|uniref:N-acetyl-1-D-myo-inositol-2-amino-2-deoxy-alpha- D-glucopyranoside deacetylase n=1 Tax=unclassified Corynebacterium TaxID=2624378 RepID=UPI00216A4687|nr:MULTISPECIES: N-acetyl-1-D-myo-inositol-2-amino-2-deoxy-alpha-D-glucopyranoside deacetylase [unclassified Corynebacterium]MCS4491746.1 N-acetyl-1-D-myo-inositol-2-amino-2-deoxy-alpha-D-glucopyranoside deacetylase [Corynebacterium sp. ES2715-CONJ3]MCS4531851.1 N-acetyl-1-D-myo-inositol-2-amino-2-deoxy-alpha-D-glucopyranoside deacetylase [Corynebacterium sp. ES2730-CONJ]MCU9519248.1 N-acetyl-1-D-myo-inositol-2-amino-2-deoxy-alpha-D-glucopyranoside deacetylase [Corynebacterium sp. ES2794-CONJ1]